LARERKREKARREDGGENSSHNERAWQAINHLGGQVDAGEEDGVEGGVLHQGREAKG
jgi:hypothetical protein